MASYDDCAENYDSLFVDKRAQAENAWVQADLFARKIHRGSVLDLACGTGLALELMKPRDYLGVDISAKMLSVARRKFPEQKFLQADIGSLPYSGQLRRRTFDSVICLFCGLSYLDPSRLTGVLAGYHAMLNPGGQLYVMVYGGRTDSKDAYRVKGAPPRYCYEPGPLVAHAWAAGFSEVEAHPFSKYLDRLPTQAPLAVYSGLLRLEHRRVRAGAYFTILTARV